MKKEIEQIFYKLGFTSTELEVYKALYEAGPSTVMILSKLTGIPRTTVHQNIEKLKAKGLVFQIATRSKRKLVAENIDKVSLLIDEKERLVKEKMNEISNLKIDIPIIKDYFSDISNLKQVPNTEVRIYEGKQAVRRVYDDIINNSPEIKSYVDVAQILTYLPENVEKFKKVVVNGRTHLWDLQTKDVNANLVWEQYENHPNYHLKFFPENLKINAMDYLIYQDKVAIILVENDLIGLVIKSKYLNQNAEMMYDLLWSLLPNLK